MPDDEQATPTVPSNNQGDNPLSDGTQQAGQGSMPDSTTDSHETTSDDMRPTGVSSNPQGSSVDLDAGQGASSPTEPAKVEGTESTSSDSEDLMSGAPTTPETPEDPKS